MSRAGFEPATNGLKVRCSTTELPARTSVELVYCTSGIRPALRNAGLEARHRQPRLKTIRKQMQAWGDGTGRVGAEPRWMRIDTVEVMGAFPTCSHRSAILDSR